MEISEYKNIYENEGAHFFYVGNHNLILSLVKKYLPKKTLKILDAGCGTGLLAKRLETFGAVWAIDISSDALKFAKKRGIRTLQASVNNLPFRDNSFDMVISLDVIYHKKVNDRNALLEFHRVLSPGGILILRVPANKWLNSKHDKHVHTRQRYSKIELETKLKRSNFLIEKLSYVNMVLLPLTILGQITENFSKQSTESNVKTLPRVFNKILSILLSIEVGLLSNIDLPFGLGLVAVARKSYATK